jgi:hypothetical protein
MTADDWSPTPSARPRSELRVRAELRSADDKMMAMHIGPSIFEISMGRRQSVCGGASSSLSLAVNIAIRTSAPARVRLGFGCSKSGFFRRLSPFPFAGLPVVAGDAALDHFVTPLIARDDERSEVAAAEAKRAERHHNDDLQQQLAHDRPLIGNLQRRVDGG